MNSFFEAHSIYNARYFSRNEIIDTFIPSDQFYKALNANHSIIIGPRGCGKTTIFKALSYNSLESLKVKFPEIKSNFFAIYIPADRQWLKQQEKLKTILEKDKHEPLLNYFMVSNSLISAINSIEDLLKESNLNNTFFELENSIITNVKESIDLGYNGLPSFFHFKQYLYKLTVELNENINRLNYKVIDIDQFSFPNLSFVQLMDVFTLFREAVVNAVKEELLIYNVLNEKWCLCYDELEIAPSWISNELIDTLFRSVDQNFIFKLTSTPIIEYNLYKGVNASLNNDYDIIECWNTDKDSQDKWQEFCAKYVKQNFNIESPQELFGKFSWEDTIKNSERLFRKLPSEESYERSSVNYLVLKKLAKSDVSFNDFLIRKHIDPSDPYPKDNVEKDTVYRKIKPIAFSRFLFKKDNITKRSRKNVANNYGFNHIVDISDGNARNFLSLLGKFKSYLRDNKKIPTEVQSKEIKEFSNAYYLGVKNYTEGYIDGSKYSLFQIITKLAEYFNDQLYGNTFIMDPKGTFFLDSKVDSKIQEIVKAGIHNGHIIIRETENKKKTLGQLDSTYVNSVVNKKLRLSYLLYPNFNLPKREYSKISFRTIFNNRNTVDEQINIKFK